MAGAGYKLFNTGDVLTAAQVNTYLMEQSVMVFANAAARTTALTGVVAEGMLSYLKDTNAVEVYDGANWVASDDPNAIQNTIVDAKGDLISATGSDVPARLAVSATNDMVLMSDSTASTGLAWSATWTSFTPTWTGTTTNPVIGNGTLAGKYIKIGKTVIAQYHLVAGSTTTFGSGNYRFSLPINADRIAALQGGVPGSAFIEDNGVANYQAVAVRLPFADRVEFLTTSTLPVSNTSPFTWANGDFMMAEIVYGVA